MIKTNEQRIARILEIASGHFGEVKHVSLKFNSRGNWVASIKFNENTFVEDMMEIGDDATEVLKKLKNRIKKIKRRYGSV